MSRAAQRKLLITFDAFGTLFAPRKPVATQYGEVASKYGLSGYSEAQLEKSFRLAFKEESKLHPNYGKACGMKAPDWWANIIEATFKSFVPDDGPEEVPTGLISDLLTRFSSSAGYTLFPDVLPLLQAIRETKQQRSFRRTDAWPWDLTVVGVVTNSDDRVPSILKSLGLDMGTRTVENSPQIQTSELDKDISFTALSYDVGEEKPHARMLFAAEELLQDALRGEGLLSSEKETSGGRLGSRKLEDFEYLHVGDDVKDVQAAKESGWNSVFLDRKGAFKRFEKGDSTQDTAAQRNLEVYESTLSGAGILGGLAELKAWRP